RVEECLSRLRHRRAREQPRGRVELEGLDGIEYRGYVNVVVPPCSNAARATGQLSRERLHDLITSGIELTQVAAVDQIDRATLVHDDHKVFVRRARRLGRQQHGTPCPEVELLRT